MRQGDTQKTDMTFNGNIILDGIVKAIEGSGNSRPDLGDPADTTKRWGSFYMAGGEQFHCNGDFTFTTLDAWNLKSTPGTWLKFDGAAGAHAILPQNTTVPDLGSTMAAERFGSIFLTGGEKIDISGSLNIQAGTGTSVIINDVGDDVNFRVEASGVSNALFVEGSSGKVGLGTSAIPHGGNGAALLALEGPNASVDGPHIQATTAADDFPLVQYLNWTHDNIQWSFDSHWDGAAYRSSDLGSNLQWLKLSDKLRIRYSSGNTVGNTHTWSDGIALDLVTGLVGIGLNAPTGGKLHVDQSSTTAALPVLYLDQADVDEPFVKIVGEAAAATLTRSIVDVGDVSTATVVGYYKIEIDDVGNQVPDGDYFVAFHSLA